MCVRGTPVPFVHANILEKSIKGAMDRIDETGSAVKKATLQQINTKKTTKTMGQTCENTTSAAMTCEILGTLLCV